MQIKLTDIFRDASVYPRNNVNEFLITRMLANYAAGAEFPPVTVTAAPHRLVDGWHRVEVFRRKGETKIQAIVKQYVSEADIFADAVRLNIAHGQPLSSYDVRASIARLMQLGYEREQIASVVRVPADHIADIVKGFALGEGGNAPIALKGGLRHLQGQTLTDKQQTAQRHYGGHAALFYVRQLASLLDNDFWPRHSDMFASEMDALAAAWTALRATDKAA